MGIPGLLQALKEYAIPTHVSYYKGKVVAVDGYCWLHRAVYGCSTELALDKENLSYVRYCMDKVMLLKNSGVVPYIVFDGGPLPSKADTEHKRKIAREQQKVLGQKKWAAGDKAGARVHFSKSVDVTPLMAFHFIQALRAEQIDFVVAPYEADAQLAFLYRQGIVDAVISEDSDCLAYQCGEVLFKMDHSGNGIRLSLSHFFDTHYNGQMNMRAERGGQGKRIDRAAREQGLQEQAVRSVQNFSLASFDSEMFLDMCIMTGCDYLPSIPGIGIRRAYQYFRSFRNFDKVLRRILLDGKLRVPKNYKQDFAQAKATFLHQVVYDPRKKITVHLTPLTAEVERRALESLRAQRPRSIEEGVEVTVNAQTALAFLGQIFDPESAAAIAEGRIDPISKEAFHQKQTQHLKISSLWMLKADESDKVGQQIERHEENETNEASQVRSSRQRRNAVSRTIHQFFPKQLSRDKEIDENIAGESRSADSYVVASGEVKMHVKGSSRNDGGQSQHFSRRFSHLQRTLSSYRKSLTFSEDSRIGEDEAPAMSSELRNSEKTREEFKAPRRSFTYPPSGKFIVKGAAAKHRLYSKTLYSSSFDQESENDQNIEAKPLDSCSPPDHVGSTPQPPAKAEPSVSLLLPSKSELGGSHTAREKLAGSTQTGLSLKTGKNECEPLYKVSSRYFRDESVDAASTAQSSVARLRQIIHPRRFRCGLRKSAKSSGSLSLHSHGGKTHLRADRQPGKREAMAEQSGAHCPVVKDTASLERYKLADQNGKNRGRVIEEGGSDSRRVEVTTQKRVRRAEDSHPESGHTEVHRTQDTLVINECKGAEPREPVQINSKSDTAKTGSVSFVYKYECTLKNKENGNDLHNRRGHYALSDAKSSPLQGQKRNRVLQNKTKHVLREEKTSSLHLQKIMAKNESQTRIASLNQFLYVRE